MSIAGVLLLTPEQEYVKHTSLCVSEKISECMSRSGSSDSRGPSS